MVKACAAGGAELAAALAMTLWALGALHSSFTWLTAAAAAAVLGGVLGTALGGVAWAVTKRDRTIPETGHVDVDHYEVLVELEHADRAHELHDRHA